MYDDVDDVDDDDDVAIFGFSIPFAIYCYALM